MKGVVCLLCRTWYTSDPENYLYCVPGDVCGNMAMTGPMPALCSPKHPCKGILVPEDERTWKKSPKKRNSRNST